MKSAVWQSICMRDAGWHAGHTNLTRPCKNTSKWKIPPSARRRGYADAKPVNNPDDVNSEWTAGVEFVGPAHHQRIRSGKRRGKTWMAK
jgi:hypothetical protein